MSENGGKPDLLAGVKPPDLAHGPQMLPDGEHVLFTLSTGPATDQWDKAQIVVESLKSHERKTVIEGGSDARFLPTGHIVYALGGVLFAIRFDVGRLQTVGGATPIVEGVRRSNGGATGAAQFSVSINGSLIYLPGPASTSSAGLDVALIDRNGVTMPLKLPPGSYEFPRVSSDGKRVAVGTADGRDANVWIYELSGATSLRRLTNGGRNRFPAWPGDSDRVAFQSDREGDLGIFWQRDGSGTAERLTKPDKDTAHVPESWSPDGKRILFTVTKGSSNTPWTFSLEDKKATPFGDVQSMTILPAASFSPDGRWVAYSVLNDGPGNTISVFVQPFPSTGAKALIANGIHPLWSPDGTELLYRQRGQTFAVRMPTSAPPGRPPSFAFGIPHL